MKDQGEVGDPIDWFVMLGDDLKTPMIENVEWLKQEEGETMELVFDWVEAYLEHDGFEATCDRLTSRGLDDKMARRLAGYVIEERLPDETRTLDEVDLVSDLPEERTGMEFLEGDVVEKGPS